tara:strand:+ start:6727 stop:6888 length:162 start_codon:yes stop_codon:yes gene_type:complete
MTSDNKDKIKYFFIGIANPWVVEKFTVSKYKKNNLQFLHNIININVEFILYNQ